MLLYGKFTDRSINLAACQRRVSPGQIIAIRADVLPPKALDLLSGLVKLSQGSSLTLTVSDAAPRFQPVFLVDHGADGRSGTYRVTEDCTRCEPPLQGQ